MPALERRGTVSLSEGKEKRIHEVFERFGGTEEVSWWQSWEMVSDS